MGHAVTKLALERKLDQRCTRCGAPAGATGLCEPHRVDGNARSAASMRKRRRRDSLERELARVLWLAPAC